LSTSGEFRKGNDVEYIGAMKTPYGLQVIETCLTCPLSAERLFCDLSRSAIEGLDAISSSATYPKGAILFVEARNRAASS
jgi:hypothetical protein